MSDQQTPRATATEALSLIERETAIYALTDDPDYLVLDANLFTSDAAVVGEWSEYSFVGMLPLAIAWKEAERRWCIVGKLDEWLTVSVPDPQIPTTQDCAAEICERLRNQESGLIWEPTERASASWSASWWNKERSHEPSKRASLRNVQRLEGVPLQLPKSRRGRVPPAPAATDAGRDERVAGDQEKRLVRGLARRLAAVGEKP